MKIVAILGTWRKGGVTERAYRCDPRGRRQLLPSRCQAEGCNMEGGREGARMLLEGDGFA